MGGTLLGLILHTARRYCGGMTTRTPKQSATPTISYAGSDGTLIELIYDPEAHHTAFAVRRADGALSVEQDVTLPDGRSLTPYSAENTLIASGCVLLPSTIGEERDKREVLEAITAFLYRYVALPPDFEAVAAHYVLLSWVYDAFEVVPYLRARGDYGTGKTRALLAIGSICYKPFFESGASTVSPIFHILDAFQGTLILDEADFQFSDATAELTKVLNNGNAQGMPVLRTMTNRNRELNPQAFRVFGPKVVGMRHSFSDAALESRFITLDTGNEPLRPDIPLHLPRAFHSEARELRNFLLGFRLRHLHGIALDPARALPGVDPRVNQAALPLLSLVDDAAVLARIAAYLHAEQGRRRQDRADTVEAMVLTALVDGFSAAPSAYVSVGEVTERFNRLACADLGRPMTNRWMGGILRNRLHIDTMKTRGVFVVPQEEKPKVDILARRYGLNEPDQGDENVARMAQDCA